MQLLIEITEEQKKMVDAFMDLPPQVENDLASAIRHGIPFPAPHGRLIDADDLDRKLVEASEAYKRNANDFFNIRFGQGLFDASIKLAAMKTIIPASNEGEAYDGE